MGMDSGVNPAALKASARVWAVPYTCGWTGLPWPRSKMLFAAETRAAGDRLESEAIPINTLNASSVCSCASLIPGNRLAPILPLGLAAPGLAPPRLFII